MKLMNSPVPVVDEPQDPTASTEDLRCDLIVERECARRLTAHYGEHFRYLADEGIWLVWDASRWRRDKPMIQMTLFAEGVADGIHEEALAATDDKTRAGLQNLAKRARTPAGLRAMIQRARLEPGISVRTADADADSWLLNCANGTLDLRCGQLRGHEPRDLCLRQVPVAYDPEARSSVWDEFLRRAQPDPEVRSFLQRAAGYSLTGLTSDEALFFLQGPTATGKSTFLAALKGTLGDYAAVTQFDTFLRRPRGNQVRSDIASLVGRRFVSALECDRDNRIDAGQLKAITGGDAISARHPGEKQFEFKPKFKIWLAANDRPLVAAHDDAVWRRILEVPFSVQIPDGERQGGIKLQLDDTEKVGPAILRWAVEGCLEWQRGGLAPPEAVSAATEDYRNEMRNSESALRGQPRRRRNGAVRRRNGGEPGCTPNGDGQQQKVEGSRPRRSLTFFRLEES